MNFCKFLETLKSEVNSLYHLKNTQKPFPTGQGWFWKYCQANSFDDFPHDFSKTSSKKNEIVGKVSLTLSSYLYCVIAVEDVSVMDEMILQWVSYLCQNNVKHKFSSQCKYRRRQWGLRICHCYFKNIKILLCQINFIIYCYDKCQRKNNIRSFPWTVVASQRYPKNELLQMLWVFCRKTFVKVWFS